MPDDIRVSIVDALAEFNPNFNPKRTLRVLILLLCIANIACASVLVSYTDGWEINNLELFTGRNPGKFYNGTMDCFVLALLQAIILPLIAYVAVLAGKDTESSQTTETPCGCFRCCYKPKTKYATLSQEDRPKSFDSHHESTDGGQPLLNVDERTGEAEALEGYEYEVNRLNKDNRVLDEEVLTMKKALESRKGLWLGVLFASSTICQVYIGLKCISFDYSNEVREGALMGIGVLWVNLLTWALRELALKAGSEDGIIHVLLC